MLPYGRTLELQNRETGKVVVGGGGERESRETETGTSSLVAEKDTETDGREGESGREYDRATWCVRGVGGDCPTKPYGQNYHTHTHTTHTYTEERAGPDLITLPYT